MEMVFSLVLCTVLLGANANYVIRLNGRVNLPMAGNDSCQPQNCSPQPATHGSLRALFAQLKRGIDNTWRMNEIYEYSNGNIRVSQTECDKNINGTFSCTPQPMGFCYAHVTLGFHALENKQVKVVVGDVERTFLGGPATMQVTSLGRRDNTKEFSIQCSKGEPCLEDREKDADQFKIGNANEFKVKD